MKTTKVTYTIDEETLERIINETIQKRFDEGIVVRTLYATKNIMVVIDGKEWALKEIAKDKADRLYYKED